MMNKPKIPSFHTLLRYSDLGTGIFVCKVPCTYDCSIDLAQEVAVSTWRKRFMRSLSLSLLEKGMYNKKIVENDESP